MEVLLHSMRVHHAPVYGQPLDADARDTDRVTLLSEHRVAEGTRFFVSLRTFILLSAFMAMALACFLAYFLVAAGA